MTAISRATREYVPDTDGSPLVGAHVRHFDAGTSTPRTVYSNSGLSVAIANADLKTDARGYLPLIYHTAGAYKRILYDGDPDAGGVAVHTDDNLDPGVASTGGDIAVADGGTGASTAAGARTNLGAASQADLDTNAAAVAAIEAQITGVGGSLGDLAGLDTISRTQLAAGFGKIMLQRVVVDSDTTLLTCADTIPIDNTIPQISEGTEILSGIFTPISASSVIVIEVNLPLIGGSSAINMTCALFQDTTLNAIAAGGTQAPGGGATTQCFLRHTMNSPGTSSITFSVRFGGASGTGYVNGYGTGPTRLYGGVAIASLIVTEILAY